MEKICLKCGIKKDISEFHKNKSKSDGYQNWCKSCKGQLSKDRYITQHNKIRKQLDDRKQFMKDFIKRVKRLSSCSICGIKGEWLLVFHHMSNNKEFDLGRAAGSASSLKRIKNEMRKCKIVCANCHATIHHNLREKSL